MKKAFARFRTMTQNFGLVEQAQMVASTAVVVIMITIITVSIVLGRIITWFDFINIITVGIIGFASVYFSLKYGRQFEEQQREMSALNTLADAVIRTIDLEYLLTSSLQKICNLAKTPYGWIYLIEEDRLVLKNSVGASFGFFSDSVVSNAHHIPWIRTTQTERETAQRITDVVNPRVLHFGIVSWISLPLWSADQFAGALLLASTDYNFFNEKRVNLISAFRNQISFALNNARLFERLRKSEQQYADLFEHSPDMYHLVNRDGVIVGCNQTEARILGQDKSLLIGQHISKLYPADQQDRVRQMLSRVFDQKREMRDSEEQMIKADGTIIDVSVNTSLVYDENNNPILMRCVVRDITEKKKMEEKIVQAQKIDSIGNLAGGVAHDFNNILASILGSASIMRRRMKDSEPWYQYVEIIESAAKRGSSLTRQLLTFARRSRVEIHPVDLHSIIEETLQLFERSVNPNISIVKSFTEVILIMNGDEGQIQQALLNVFINARDAMPEGGVLKIETSCMSLDEDDAFLFTDDIEKGKYIAVHVSDTGTGMNKDIQKRIFEPFFTTKEHGKGTGLGLSVVYGVVKTHGGYINVQSVPKVGSTFSIYFPRLEGKYAEIPKRTSQKIIGGNEAILVVDDEETVLQTISAMLKDLGYSVETAQSGKVALSLCKKGKKFDLIILDMIMPEMDGKQFYQRLQRMKLKPKFIVSSGYSDTILGKSTFARNINGFLQKPYQVEDLAIKVRGALDAPRLRRHSAQKSSITQKSA